MVDYEKIIQVSFKAAIEAGEMIKTVKPNLVRSKSSADYVTETDIECQRIIKRIISDEFPCHLFLAEEDGGSFQPSDNLWIIDPLDGTTNFIHDLKHSAVSIAYYTGKDIMTGVIYDPYKDEMFYALKGKGAYLNGERIFVSDRNNLKTCLIATGMPFKKHDKIDRYFSCLSEVLRESSGIRRMGSAALDLAYTACGRFDGFFEGWLSPWDIAAGALIVEESGGLVCDFQGGGNVLTNGCIIASGNGIFRQLFQLVNRNLKDEI